MAFRQEDSGAIRPVWFCLPDPGTGVAGVRAARRYPDPNNALPLVIHAPTQVVVKGTSAVLAAIEKLRATHRFEFRLIQSMPHRAALDLVRQCDVFLDQFVVGDRGAAALEAMAFGKPTVCYIKPALWETGFYRPIVNATQESLAEVLRDLLEDGPRRREIGLRSRAHVEEHHDAHKICKRLMTIYEELLAASRVEPRPPASLGVGSQGSHPTSPVGGKPWEA
jgi:glycosyltransferase involved in cell wall biosynthesis